MRMVAFKSRLEGVALVACREGGQASLSFTPAVDPAIESAKKSKKTGEEGKRLGDSVKLGVIDPRAFQGFLNDFSG